jgi:ATP-dependent Zn protease
MLPVLAKDPLRSRGYSPLNLMGRGRLGQNVPDKQRLTAYHEAGHVIAGVTLGVMHLNVSIIPDLMVQRAGCR